MMYGLYYAYEKALLSLPLLSVHAAATIKELAAQVNLTQTYRNDAAFPIEAKYSFPIPARAAVSSFAMIKQDGTRVVGSVVEKFEARKTYDAAVSQGQQASLMEQQTPDVFRVALGNIPPHEQVQIELIYSTELAEDEENDSVRFHLPVHIGARYGQTPDDFKPATSSSPFLTISTTVEALAPISDIGSPSHKVITELGPDPALPNFKDLPSSHYARVSLSSDAALDKDFVLTFKSTGLDAPRCVAELHPTNDTAALALTFVPRFTLPDLERQEFILVVDRSGSMEGPRIAAARKALVVLLRALPHKDTLFQLVSFGFRATSLWSSGSRPYNAATLAEATRHVDGMAADYGGTEIRNALAHAFAHRARDRPTSVLVLTDGEAWDLSGVLDTVKEAVEGAPDGAPLHVSVLGIGNSVSTAMCEGIARVGHGTFMLVGEQEKSFAGKVARLLKAARTPVISNITVDWGRPLQTVETANLQDKSEVVVEAGETTPQNKTLNVFDVDVDPTLLDDSDPPPAPPVILPPPAPVQQSPFRIRNLFPGSRVNIYAILQGQTVPETVTLRGEGPNGAVIELPIPVTLSRLPNAPGAPPALHALAARKIIQDLEDGHHEIPDSGDADLLERTVRAHIVRLGTTYQITSTHTSFVAVDESQTWRPRYVRPPPESESPTSDGIAYPASIEHDELDDDAGFARYAPVGMQQYLHPATAPKPFKQAVGRLLSWVQPMYYRSGPPLRNSAGGGGTPLAGKKPSAAEALPPHKPDDGLERLARLQSFDGAFASPSAVLALVPLKAGKELTDVRDALPTGATDELVASVLALASMGERMRVNNDAEEDAWAGIYEKTRAWVEAALRDLGAKETVQEVEEKVARMIAIMVPMICRD
ncbi:von Willebrand factor type A domain-containing protein [Mycena albidolilacea]|uniref:von Willebrand factor type A domain-containing protein n=1 Tax=Mycena albidolilacea TaxID=1033008 RepID=A0AAD7ALG1_9AGAR|nr:von Willebrand factor type A domain-containing protein [Mycena albidolilacea]